MRAVKNDDSVCVCVLLVCVRSITETIERRRRRKMLDSYQLSSRFLPGGILREACVRSLDGSLKHTQAHTQCRLHAHGDKLLICSNTHPSMTALQFPVLFLESIKRYKKVKCVYIYMWQHQYSKQAAIGFLQLFVGRKWNMGARREYKS